MSFLGIVKQDLAALETDALSAAKTTLNYIDGVLVTDIVPVLENSLLAAIEKLGQEAVAALLNSALGNGTSSASSTTTTTPTS